MPIIDSRKLGRKEFEDYSASQKTPRSAWGKGVRSYAAEMLDRAFEGEPEGKTYTKEELYKRLSNDYDDRDHAYETRANPKLRNTSKEYGAFSRESWGGNYDIYDRDIAKRLSNPTELKKTNNGLRKPNKNEEWLDTQARALYQAYNFLVGAYNKGK